MAWLETVINGALLGGLYSLLGIGLPLVFGVMRVVLKPAGLEASKGLVTTQFLKQPGDPAWANDEEVKACKEFLKKCAPSTNADDYSVLVAYMNVHGVTLALKKCGDDLTRENLIPQATSLHGERLTMMLPGITISTKPDDYTAFKTLRIAVFDGMSWTLLTSSYVSDYAAAA